MTKKVIFVADMFLEQYIGGAELTTEAILNKKPINILIEKILCSKLTKSFMDNNRHNKWVIFNFSSMSQENKLYFVKNLDYSIVEYDYKICKFRLPQLHQDSLGCNCIDSLEGRINRVFYGYAKNVWFMSDEQRQYFIDKVPELNNNKEKCIILSSVFSEGDLRFIESIKDNEKDDKYIILQSDSWVKGTARSVEYAKENKLNFELVKNLPYHEMLIKLSTSKGLIFTPNGFDTCPRIVIESKLLGCELILNEFVQHKEEKWFKEQSTCMEYLRQNANKFWNIYE